MTYTTAFDQTATESGSFGADQAQVMKVEFVIDSHRVNGEMRYGGPPRRLVDLLNGLDAGYTTIYNGSMGTVQRSDEQMKHFDLAQVRRDAILYAIPLSDTPRSGYGEIVPKVPVETSLALPGYQLTGNCYHVPNVDPSTIAMLSGRSFIPMTDVVIKPATRAKAAREEIIVVNLARVLVYAPRPRSV